MDFKKYTSIDEVMRTKTINNYIKRGYTNQPWTITTKIHGANFSVLIHSEGIKCSRRNSWLKEDENFNNYKDVVERYKKNIEQVGNIVITDYNLKHDTPIQIYGEIFGGHYPHPDVPKSDFSMVQSGVWYCPHIDFYPFDIYIRGEEENNYPLDPPEFERIIEEAGFKVYAKSIFTGTFQECLDYPNDYQDPIHKLFGLPEIEGNICEGNVLRPIKACVEPCGSRVILKSKNEKFKERKSKRKPKPPVIISPELEEVNNIIDEYINENRLRNVLSNLGEITEKDFGKVLGSFVQDVLKDVLGDDPNIFDKITSEEEKRAKKDIQRSCAGLISSNFVNIIDNCY